MEGTLLVPPDKGTIIGRAIWKPRYVHVGSPHREQPTSPLTFSQVMTTSRIQASRASTPKGPPKPSEAVYLSIYKSKDDWDPIQQHAIGSVTSCQVQDVTHRKQGPVLPTLIISISPDPSTDKLRKRRSSRTAGLTSTKDTGPTTLWFRPGDDHYTLYDWARYIQPLIQPNMPGRAPASPVTPASPTFTNPFAAKTRESSAYYQAQGPLNSNPLQHKTSSQTYSSRERDRPKTYSESPSLRSKRSDVSSQTSSMNALGFQNFTSMHPADLPSPAATIGEYQGEFIEGWTSAQGRSSTISSPIRGRESFGSHTQAQMPGSLNSSSPPGPRETILDRAFQLGFIPVTEPEQPQGGGKLTSLAKFEALAQEDEERRRRKRQEAADAGKEDEGMKSAWDLDDDSDDGDDVVDEEEEDEDEDEDEEDSDDLDAMSDDDEQATIPQPAKQALDFIRRGSAQQWRESYRLHGRMSEARTPLRSPTYERDSSFVTAMNNSGSSNPRPLTGHSGRRPGFAQRTHSQPQLAGTPSATMHDPMPSSSSRKASDDDVGQQLPTTSSPSTAHSGDRLVAADQRQSASSTKRLSFTEFTKRLSSTSSLLLVQSNASGGLGGTGSSSRGSSEVDLQHLPRGNLHPRGSVAVAGAAAPAAGGDRESWDKRCGWRGSVGVFGGEGGFL